MFNQTQWTFTGASNQEYTFTISPKSAGLPAKPGVVLFAYTHPRGHRAGYQANVLAVAESDDMSALIPSTEAKEILMDECWNCNFMLAETDAAERGYCLKDLYEAYAPRCQQVLPI